MSIGSVCSGYEGLGMAIQEVIGGELAWVADNDPGASSILAHRYPGVPNLGDITETDWAAVEPVDIFGAGFPCTDVSQAGEQAGLREDTRSGVWNHCARAISALRPSLVVIENVRGFSVPEPIATWNRARGAWERRETNILCGHSALYSEIWPTSGSMRSGSAYPPAISASEHPMNGGASSSSPGPLLKTPTAQLAVNGGPQHPAKRKAGGHGPTLEDEVVFLLPPPASAA